MNTLRPLILAGIIFFFSALNVQGQAFSPSVRPFITDSAEITALVDATVIDGTGSPARSHQTVIITRGLISQTGKTSDIQIPQGAKIINCGGKTLIPGLVMLHEHFYYTILLDQLFNVQEMPYSFPRMYLAGGATTIRTAGCIEPQTDLSIQRMIRGGTMIGPDMDVTAPYIERKGWDIPSMFLIRDSAEAATMASFWADRGCTSFKMYTHATVEDLIATVRVAHQRGLKVTGHIGTITYREAAEAGIDDLEHGFLVAADFDHQRKGHEYNEPREFQALINLDVNSPEMKSLIQLLVAKHVAVTSTLPVFAPSTNGELVLGGGEKALIPPALDSVRARWQRRQNKDSILARLFSKGIAWEKQFFDAGGLLVCGTDPTGSGRVLPGYGSRTEIEFLVQGGFSVAQAIQVATLNGAKYLGRDKMIGSIETGKRADIVLLDGDLDANIHNIRNTEIVFKQGIGYDSRKIFESVTGHVGMN
jgi:imidazolonepropionase-like amidohydrolase